MLDEKVVSLVLYGLFWRKKPKMVSVKAIKLFFAGNWQGQPGFGLRLKTGRRPLTPYKATEKSFEVRLLCNVRQI